MTSRFRIVGAAGVFFALGLWFNRRTRYNRYLTTSRMRVVRSTDADKPVVASSLFSCLEPIKFVYDQDDKLSYSKLKTFADILKTALIELVPDDKSIPDLPVCKHTIVNCTTKSLHSLMGKIVAQAYLDPIHRGNTCFVYVHPDKPKTIAERLNSMRQYLEGRPKWIGDFADASILLSHWISLGPSASLQKTGCRHIPFPNALILTRTKDKMEIDFENAHGEFILVDWPLIIENVPKAIAMLGGLDNISNIVRTPNEMLSLNLTPNNLVMRGAFLSRSTRTRCLVLKLCRKRGTNTVRKISCIGRVVTSFDAQSMVDFQYLPMTERGDGSYQSIHDHLTFREVRDWTTLNRPDTSLYMIPASFCRFRNPVATFFQTNESSPSTSGIRIKHKRNTVLIEFDLAKPVPQESLVHFPLDSTRNIELWNKVTQQFATRPIWTRLALAGTIGTHINAIRDVLNSVAYYYIGGPWNRCWVRFGFDPRLDSSTKQYQVVDYRASFSSLHHQSVIRARYNPKIARVKATRYNQITPTKVEENSYVFRKDLVPGARNIFYQLIDMDDPGIRAIWHENDGKEPKRCHLSDGWCIQGYQNLCRAIVYHTHKELISAYPTTTTTSLHDNSKLT